MAEQKAVIMDADGVRRALTRIAFEIIEKNKGAENLLLAGVKRAGCFWPAHCKKARRGRRPHAAGDRTGRDPVAGR